MGLSSPQEAMEDTDHEDLVLLGRVHRWRESLVQHPPHVDDEGLIAHLYLATSELYKGILPLLGRQLGPSTTMFRKLERGYSSLVLWSHSYDASGGKLDAALEHCQDLRRITIRLLVNINTAVLDRLIPRTGLGQDASLSHVQEDARSTVTRALAVLTDTDHDGGSKPSKVDNPEIEEDSLQRIASNIRTLVQALVDLGPLFEEPIVDKETRHEAPARAEISTPVANLVSLIKYMFPKCEPETAHGIAAAVLSTWCQIQERAVSQSAREAEVRPAPPKAKTLVETLFHDSGIGTSIGTRSSYAETVRSYRGTSDKPVNIQLPEMPEKGRNGGSFRCEACQCTVRPGNSRHWKLHLMNDARPYMCIEPSCSEKFQPFADKEDWTIHISGHYSQRSGEQLRCPICGIAYTTIGDGSRLIATHLAHHLEPIAAEVIIPGVTFTGPDDAANEQNAPDIGSNGSMDSNAIPPNDDRGNGKDRENPPAPFHLSFPRCTSCNRAYAPEWKFGLGATQTLCNACDLHYAKLERERELEQRGARPNDAANEQNAPNINSNESTDSNAIPPTPPSAVDQHINVFDFLAANPP
ncbi:hypothetical protein RB595_008197 [Gaeumannomyces hyphopodioides]